MLPHRRPRRRWASACWRRSVVLAPWTIRNAVVLDRFVPVSTGGGKALYIGTYLDADGDGPKLRELLLSRTARPAGAARTPAGRSTIPTACARAGPGPRRGRALSRDGNRRGARPAGRQNLEDDVTEEPLRFAGMLADKGYETWTDPARAT